MIKIYALTDLGCRPLSVPPTGRSAANCETGPLLFKRLPTCRIVLIDKGCGSSNAIRRHNKATGDRVSIPPKFNRS